MLHLRAHPPSPEDIPNYIPFGIGLLNIMVVPWLFLSRRWASTAYLINGLTVIFGIIFMSHESLTHLPKIINIKTILLNTTMPLNIILCAKFAMGKAVFDLHFTDLEKELPLRYKFIRWPNMGWWIIHFIVISLVYAIGVIYL